VAFSGKSGKLGKVRNLERPGKNREKSDNF